MTARMTVMVMGMTARMKAETVVDNKNDSEDDSGDGGDIRKYKSKGND
jgi:hypothetical protein